MDGAFHLGDWLVQPRLNTLACGDRETRVEPKAMAVLVCLADQAGEVVAKEQLMRAVWPDTFVTDDVLTHAISELRKVLADDVRAPRFIQTIPKGGYRLIATFARVAPSEPAAPHVGGAAPRAQTRPRSLYRWLALGGAVGLTVLVALATQRRMLTVPTPRVMRLAIDNRSTGPLMTHHMSELPSFRLSPDGTRLVFIVGPALNNRIYQRALDQSEPTPIAGTEGGIIPFFSPDGSWLGFASKGRLKKVSLEDETLVDLCAAPSLRGATWTSGGMIVFSPASDGGLWQIPATGGTPVPLTALDRTRHENSHRWPEALPGNRVVFTVRRGGDVGDADIEAVDLRTAERHLLIEGGSFGQYVPSGHLVYGHQTSLLAVAFDASALQVRGSPSRVVDGVITGSGTGSVDFSISATGSLAYIPKAVGADERRVVWVDENGQAQDVVAARGAYDAPRLSPDGRQVAITVAEGSGSNVWTYDLQSGAARRVTRGLRNGWSVWDPDGRHLTISAATAEARNIVAWDLDAERSGPPLAPSAQWQWPTSWSPDGRALAYTEYSPSSHADVWILEGDRRRPFVATPGMDTAARFSRDGRWLAYASDETGAPHVYIKPFPGPGPALQVSDGGGDQPVWDPAALRLYFRQGDKMFVVELAGHPARPGKPRLVFEGSFRGAFFNHSAGYDVAPGGRRFVMIKESERAVPKTEINLIVNWSDELARRVPPGDH